MGILGAARLWGLSDLANPAGISHPSAPFFASILLFLKPDFFSWAHHLRYSNNEKISMH